MENGYPIGEDLSMVETFAKRGVRYLTLCHSADNQICGSSTDRKAPGAKGLSDFGRKVVAECNRLGVLVDVSHMSDKSFYDCLQASKAPIFASHSCCRALCDNPRNLSDDMIKALAKDGGVIQMCFLSAYVKAPKPNPEREAALKELEAKYGPRRQIQQNIKDETQRAKIQQEFQATTGPRSRTSSTTSSTSSIWWASITSASGRTSTAAAACPAAATSARCSM
jgi:membrane dipeptidase